MPLGVKVLSLIGGIGSVCCFIPFFQRGIINGHSNILETKVSSSPTGIEGSPSSSEVPPSSEPDSGGAVQAEIKKEPEEENCKIVQSPENVFWDLLLSERMSSYYTITCKNASISSDDKRMEGEWSILLPDVFMTDRQNLRVGKGLGIKTVTASAGERKHKTVFAGSKLQSSSVTGEWGGELESADGKWAAKVTVSGGLNGSDSIYLLFSENS